MHSIDLVKFADHSVKIPAVMLNHTPSKQPFPTWKIVVAHWLDLWVVTTATIMVVAMTVSFKSIFFTSEGMKKAGETGFTATALTFGLILWAHFFFSYFLNHGQTPGLFGLKRRVVMKDKSFRDALHWSLISSVTCLTGGAAAFAMKLNDNYAGQDYLYHELLMVKDHAEIDLLKKTVDEEQEDKTFSQAA